MEATGFDNVLNSLEGRGKEQEIDAHPEKRMKAAWKSFVEDRLMALKVEYPKFRRSQLLEMINKEVSQLLIISGKRTQTTPL